MNSNLFGIILAVLLGSGFISASLAATLSVDCGAGEKIQDKIGLSRPGDTILVTGTCAENVIIPSEVVRLILDGQRKTVIQAPPQADAIFIRGREIMVRGFTLTGGRDGIHLSGAAAGASAIIDGNLIRRTGRRGIHLDHGSVGRIANNTIQDVPDEGINIQENAVARIGFLIADIGPNTIRNAGSHGIAVTRGSGAWIVGNNIASNKGHGILINRNSQADILANAINGNGVNGITASHNSGVNFRSEGTPRQEGPNLTDAATRNAGFGVSCSIGGYVDGPLGTLSGVKGPKEIEKSCLDRLTPP